MRSQAVVLGVLLGCSPQAAGDGGAVVGAPAVKGEAKQGAAEQAEPAKAKADAAEPVRELPAAPPEDGPMRDRGEFAATLARIKPGSTEAEVLRFVGPPDDVRTERDAGGISAARTVEVWRWGTNGHLSFGTLGTVHMQADRTVQYVFGDRPPAAVGLEEAEVKRLLRVLDAVPSYNATHDPLRVIQAVNALQPLGKDTALAVLDEYLRVSSWLDDPGREGVFLVARVLFDAPVGEALPPMRVGAPHPEPADMTAVPRFPLVIVDDIPLALVRGYSLGGQAEAPEVHLRWCRDRGVLRGAPLRPPDAPLAAVERAFADGSPYLRTRGGVDPEVRAHAYDQALRLVDTVVRVPVDVHGRKIGGEATAADWQRWRGEVDGAGARWDARRDVYVRRDGELLPPAAQREFTP